MKLRTALFLGTLSLLVTLAHALTIAGYNATLDNRFSSGFPNAPVSNPDFQYANYDFSGVGWISNKPQFGVTLISNQNFVTAEHMAPDENASVSFLSAAGILYTYTVASIAPMNFRNGVASDLVVGTFTTTVSADLRAYNILDLGTLDTTPDLLALTDADLASYIGLNLLTYGQTGRVGTNILAGFGYSDFNSPYDTANPENPDPALIDSIFSVTLYNSSERGSAVGQSGDSGSPSFVVIDGQLVLFGVHSAIDRPTNPTATFDTPLFFYTNQIAAELAKTGHTLATIPEPATIATLLGALAFLALALRRWGRG